MRRPSALLLTLTLTLALVASVVGITTSATATPPGTTPDTGSFYVAPDPPTVGQPVKLTGNFPSGTFMVTFYKRTGDDTWASIGTDQSNTSGNAYLTTHVVNEQEDLYARITSGGSGRTEVKTVTPVPAPVVGPSGPDVGSLYQVPETYSEGDVISMTANFPSGTFPITLYRESAPNAWTAIATKTSNSSGNATFTGFPVTSTTQNVFARKANNERTEVDPIAPSPKLTLSIRRDCPVQNCASTATAYGELDPAQEGRQVSLQYLSGSSWVPVVGASPATSGADGKVTINFPVGSLSQWASRSYRLTGAADGSNPAVTSNTIQFMPGPTELGHNVLRVDVDKGVFPATKGPEYPAKATLSTDGQVSLNNVKVEEFGVRGFSTAGYPKKPFKLKFEDSPNPTKVFGMEPDKSWTLLANWLDRSFVRDKVGLELGREMKNGWTPDSRYVELFLNDRYQGAYLMTESVKIDGDRVDVDKKQGMIMETDGKTVEDSKLGFTSSKGIVWAFKDPDNYEPSDPEQVSDAKKTAIKDRINAFESKLYSDATREQYVDFLDVDKAIDFYFIREFTKERDGDMYRSNYVSWDPSFGSESLSDNKLHFGPAWDFDRSAGITGETDAVHVYVDSPQGFYLRGTGTHSEHPTYRTHWFVQLFKSASFKSTAEAQWDAKRTVFESASQIARDADVALGPGAENDQKRWPQSRRYKDRGSHQDEIDYVADWYDKRFAWLDANL